MNKSLLLKLGFGSNLSDELLEESWVRLIRFFETEDNLKLKVVEVPNGNV